MTLHCVCIYPIHSGRLHVSLYVGAPFTVTEEEGRRKVTCISNIKQQTTTLTFRLSLLRNEVFFIQVASKFCVCVIVNISHKVKNYTLYKSMGRSTLLHRDLILSKHTPHALLCVKYQIR